MRLFFALDISDAIRDALVRYVNLLRSVPGVRFMPPESYHVTLKFLGEVQGEAEVQRAAEQVDAEKVFVAFRKIGFFPNAGSPRVFWAGIEADEKLGLLAGAIERQMASVGLDREERAYRPHLTLARSGSGSPTPRREEKPVSGFRALASAVAHLPEPDFGTMTASEFYLYESKLSPRGAQYKKIARFPLH